VQAKESEAADTTGVREKRKENILTSQNFLCLPRLYMRLRASCIKDQSVIIYTRIVRGVWGYGSCSRMYLELRRLVVKGEEMYCMKLPCVGGDMSK
jgi:hypothetical protein